MIEIDRQLFLEVAEESYMDVREDYSGRGMYGKSCPGVIGSLSQFALFLLAFDEAVRVQDEENDPIYTTQAAAEIADTVSTDSMGFDTIFYFPTLVLTD
jgi:hypothetical protein